MRTKRRVLSAIESMEKHNFLDDENKITNTDWFLPREYERNYWKFFEKDALNHIRAIENQYGYKISKIENFWFQQYMKGDFHSRHTHGGSSFSNIYYAELPNQKAATAFWFCGKEYKIEVEEGDMLSFPGNLIHESKPLDNDKRKTVIVFNTIVE